MYAMPPGKQYQNKKIVLVRNGYGFVKTTRVFPERIAVKIRIAFLPAELSYMQYLYVFHSFFIPEAGFRIFITAYNVPKVQIKAKIV